MRRMVMLLLRVRIVWDATGSMALVVLHWTRSRLFAKYPVGVYRCLTLIPLQGIESSMNSEAKSSVLKRLNRIEGQVKGIGRMVDENRYCIDIVTQIAAVRAALGKAEEEILRDHVAHCVEHAIESGDKDEQRQKITEIMEVLGRARR